MITLSNVITVLRSHLHYQCYLIHDISEFLFSLILDIYSLQEPPKASEVLYKDSMLYFDDNRKWRERLVVARADYSLELHDSQEVLKRYL